MKLKNINLVERHIEKIVFAVALLGALAIVLLYCVGTPYAATVGSDKAVAPAAVGPKVVERATALKTQIERPDSQIPPLTVRKDTETFAARLAGAVGDITPYPVPLGRPGLPRILTTGGEPQQQPLVVVPPPPAPTNLRVRQGNYLAAAYDDAEANKELVALIGEQEPRDFVGVSVGGIYLVNQFRDNLRRAPLKPGEQRVPEDWWRGRLFVTDVILHRQTLDPATGQWGLDETLAPLPTQHSFRQPQEVWLTQDAAAAVRVIGLEQESLARPAFVPLAGGRTWQPPGEGKAIRPEDNRRISGLTDEIEALRGRIARLHGPPAAPEAAPTGQGPPSRGAEGQPPARSGGAAPGRPAAPAAAPPGRPSGGTAGGANPANTAELTKLNAELQAKLDERARLQGAIFTPAAGEAGNGAGALPAGTPGAPGIGPGGLAAGPGGRRPGMYAGDDEPMPMAPGRPMPAAPARSAPPGSARPEGRTPSRGSNPPLPGAGSPESEEGGTIDEVPIWAHDITAKPGMIYRYSLQVSVLNPLFQRPQLGPEQRQEFFNRIALTSDPSPWTEPVTIEPERHFFVVNAVPGQDSAVVEVWKVYAGQWRMKEFTVQHGDPIGRKDAVDAGNAGRTEVDLGVGATVVDIEFGVPGQAADSKTTRLLYVRQGDDTLRERTVEADRESPKRLELRAQMGVAGGVASAAK